MNKSTMLIADLLKTTFTEEEFDFARRLCRLGNITKEDIEVGDINDQRLKIFLALLAVHMGKTAHYGDHIRHLDLNKPAQVLGEQHYNLKRKWVRFCHMIEGPLNPNFDQMLETLGDLAILAIMAMDAILELEKRKVDEFNSTCIGDITNCDCELPLSEGFKKSFPLDSDKK